MSRGVCGSALEPHSCWERDRWRCTKVTTGIGKSDLAGSQGRLWKRGDDGSRTEAHRETAGLATVPYHHARATFLSRLCHRQANGHQPEIQGVRLQYKPALKNPILDDCCPVIQPAGSEGDVQSNVQGAEKGVSVREVISKRKMSKLPCGYSIFHEFDETRGFNYGRF